jgi:hypothetical protein
LNKNITASFLPQLSERMKDTQAISTITRSYMWNDLIIEKRVSMGWLYKLYEDSIFHDFVLIFSSPVH